MIKTKIVTSARDIPSEWIFERYLGLTEKLVGQNIMITSCFNPNDDTPSMSIYWSENYRKYKFKDHSTGSSGDGWDLMKLILPGKSNLEIADKLMSDFLKSSTEVGCQHLKCSFSIKDFELRKWTVSDKDYWLRYNIGSRILDKFHVRPLEYLVTEKIIGDQHTELENSRKYMYGFFNKEGVIYKVYSPMCTLKFLNFKSYLQGSDQLEGKDYLIISSSLKDIMSLSSLGIKSVESVAPNSENSFLDSEQINLWRLKYKKIITLFDNDQPGINAMERYKTLYGFPYAHLRLGKDLSDSVRDHGVDKTRDELLTILRQKIYE